MKTRYFRRKQSSDAVEWIEMSGAEYTTFCEMNDMQAMHFSESSIQQIRFHAGRCRIAENVSSGSFMILTQRLLRTMYLNAHRRS